MSHVVKVELAETCSSKGDIRGVKLIKNPSTGAAAEETVALLCD